MCSPPPASSLQLPAPRPKSRAVQPKLSASRQWLSGGHTRLSAAGPVLSAPARSWWPTDRCCGTAARRRLSQSVVVSLLPCVVDLTAAVSRPIADSAACLQLSAVRSKLPAVLLKLSAARQVLSVPQFWSHSRLHALQAAPQLSAARPQPPTVNPQLAASPCPSVAVSFTCPECASCQSATFGCLSAGVCLHTPAAVAAVHQQL